MLNYTFFQHFHRCTSLHLQGRRSDILSVYEMNKNTLMQGVDFEGITAEQVINIKLSSLPAKIMTKKNDQKMDYLTHLVDKVSLGKDPSITTFEDINPHIKNNQKYRKLFCQVKYY